MNNTPNRITLTDAPATVDPAYKKAVGDMFRAARAEGAGSDLSRLACEAAARQADEERRWRERPKGDSRRW